MPLFCCRLCLLNGSDLRPILDLTVNSNESNEPVTFALSQLIVSYLSIEPVNEGTKETYVCSECRNTIAKWHWFRESCLQNDAVYQKMAQDPGKDDSPEQMEDYPVVEVKQEPEIEIGAENFNENLFTEPLAPLSNKKQKKRGRPKKVVAEKSTTAMVEGGKPPGKKKLGRPRIPDSERKPRSGQICTLCGKEVKNMSGHIRMHNQDRCYQCPHCPKNFYSNSSWKCHVNVHTKEVKFSCHLCDKFFWRSETLKMHLNSHSEEPVFKCPYCPKAYRNRSGLVNHRKTHTQGPDIPCKDCGKLFYSKGQLSKHAVKHLEVKPFACKICERRFSRKTILAGHMEKAHPDCKESEELTIAADGDSGREGIFDD